MAEVYWTLMDKHKYKRSQGVISVHAHIVENMELINWSNDSRVACPHSPYEGQVLKAGDELAGIEEG